MVETIIFLGLWCWVIIGLVLLLLEVIVPGVFLVFFGLAALVTAAICGMIGDHAGLGTWQGQMVVFLIFSVLFVVIGRRYFHNVPKNDEPLLNNRTEQLIGEITTLEEPIKDGHGRVRINDTTWRVTGGDLPKGTRVKLVAFVNGAFEVTPAD